MQHWSKLLCSGSVAARLSSWAVANMHGLVIALSNSSCLASTGGNACYVWLLHLMPKLAALPACLLAVFQAGC